MEELFSQPIEINIILYDYLERAVVHELLEYLLHVGWLIATGWPAGEIILLTRDTLAQSDGSGRGGKQQE